MRLRGLIETPSTPICAMSHDPLSDVLRSVRLRGAVFYYVNFDGDWAAETPPSPLLASALMPGADHVLAYHLMARGEGWAATDGEAPVRLAPGDIVMFPQGDGHVISSAPGLRAKEDHSDWRFTTRNDPKPITVAYHNGVLRPGSPGPADEAGSVVVCGFVACDTKPFNPLISALPRLMHLRAGHLGPWTAQVLDQAVAESRERRAGSAAVLERASEFVFVDAARRYLESVINEHAPLGHHLFDVAQAQRVGRVPGQHHLQRIVHPLDHLAQFLDHHHPVFRLGSAYQHRFTATEPCCKATLESDVKGAHWWHDSGEIKLCGRLLHSCP